MAVLTWPGTIWIWRRLSDIQTVQWIVALVFGGGTGIIALIERASVAAVITVSITVTVAVAFLANERALRRRLKRGSKLILPTGFEEDLPKRRTVTAVAIVLLISVAGALMWQTLRTQSPRPAANEQDLRARIVEIGTIELRQTKELAVYAFVEVANRGAASIAKDFQLSVVIDGTEHSLQLMFVVNEDIAPPERRLRREDHLAGKAQSPIPTNGQVVGWLLATPGRLGLNDLLRTQEVILRFTDVGTFRIEARTKTLGIGGPGLPKYFPGIRPL